MEIIVFNYNGSKVNLYEAAIMITYAYITGDATACAGTIQEEMFDEERFRKCDLPSKIRLLKQMAEDPKNTDKGFDGLRESLECFKAISKLKHKSSKEIVLLKRLEKTLAEVFEIVTEPMLSFSRKSGITEFLPLADGKTLGYYPLNYFNPETPGRPDEFTASGLLQRISLDHTNHELFFLPSHFFDEEFAVTYKVINDNASTLQPGEIYLQHCFTLPSLQNLKTAEFKKTREQLSVPGAAYRNALNEWITRCYTAGNTTEQAFFTENVLPAAIAFQQQLIQNETIEFCKKVNFTFPQFEIYAGEIPVGLLWAFYKHAEIINDETYGILQEVLQDDAFAAQRWPVMVLKNNAYLSTLRPPALPEVTAETLIAKKSISVD